MPQKYSKVQKDLTGPILHPIIFALVISQRRLLCDKQENKNIFTACHDKYKNKKKDKDKKDMDKKKDKDKAKKSSSTGSTCQGSNTPADCLQPELSVRAVLLMADALFHACMVAAFCLHVCGCSSTCMFNPLQ